MRHFGAFVLAVVVFSGSVLPLAAQAAQQPQPAAAAEPEAVIGKSVVQGDAAGISGTVVSPDGAPVPNVVVRARNLVTNGLDGATRTSEKGDYALLNLKTGSYVLEIVDQDGNILGTSAFVAVTAGTVVSGVPITAATGALTAAAPATGVMAALGGSAARALTAAAAAAGVAGVVVPAALPTASPSR